MILREFRSLILKRLSQFPAVAILGSRQCGKTTLAKQLGGAYFDMEQAGVETLLDIQWNKIIADSRLIILDEAQSAPAVFPRLRGAIDDNRARKGRFLLLGSVSPALVKTISESLAGRLAVVELSPFVLPELPPNRLDDLWLYGGYPQGGILDETMFGVWQDSYLKLLVQRDLPAWGLAAKPQTTDRLVRMLAALHGQILNASLLGSSLGLDSKTVAGYCDHLEGAFLIRRLRPYLANVRKRLTKSTKVFWRDSGLLHALMGVNRMEQLLSQPWVGASWEGFVIEQILSTLHLNDQLAQPYFFRTSDGHEIDLVLDFGIECWAIEIKLTSQPDPKDWKRLEKNADLIAAHRRFLISRQPAAAGDDNRLACNLTTFLDILKAR